jgi:cell division protein FtsL
MIGERFAVSGRVRGEPARIEGQPALGRLTAQPSVAGRQRLTQSLGDSMLVRLLLAMSLLVLALLLYLFQATQASVHDFTISDLRAQQMQLRLENAQLRLNATSLQSIQRIDDVATTQLKMSKPPDDSIIWVSPVIPHVVALPAINADVVTAQERSSPRAWVSRLVHAVKSSL